MEPMRIGRGDITGNREIELQPAQSSRQPIDSTGSTGLGGTEASDSIALNGVSDLVQLALNAGTGERTDHVQQLKQSVESNQYQVDPELVSRALIRAHTNGE